MDDVELRKARVERQLIDLFESSSPEQFFILRDTQVFKDHLLTVNRWLEQSGKIDEKGINAEAVDEAGARLMAINPGVLAQAIALRSFSDNPEAWPSEFDAFLAINGPESYHEAKRLGRLEDHIAFVVEIAKAQLRADSANGVDDREAKASAKSVLVKRSSPISPPPAEMLSTARGARALSFQQFADMTERYDTLPLNDRSSFARDLMTTILERPDFGILLPKSAMFSRFSGQELYLHCLGAHHFGSGRLQQATEIFSQAKSAFGTPLAFLCLANSHRAVSDKDRALAVLKEGLKKYPDDHILRICAAGVAFSMGDTVGANKIFASHAENFFAGFPRREYVEMRRKELSDAIADKKLYRDEINDIYDEKFAYNTWWNYWFHFNSYSRHQHSEGVLAEIVPEYLNSAFGKISVPPKVFVEIGTMCGEIIFRVADENPDMRCFGVDRQSNLKILNDQAYRLPNLQFIADDIFAFMAKNRISLSDGMLFHVRTSPFLYPAFLEKLYHVAGEFGIKYVALFESYPISYEKRVFQTFEDMKEVAEIRGGGLIHHNYPKILEQAGFRVIHEELPDPTLLFAGADSAVFLLAERLERDL